MPCLYIVLLTPKREIEQPFLVVRNECRVPLGQEHNKKKEEKRKAGDGTASTKMQPCTRKFLPKGVFHAHLPPNGTQDREFCTAVGLLIPLPESRNGNVFHRRLNLGGENFANRRLYISGLKNGVDHEVRVSRNGVVAVHERHDFLKELDLVVGGAGRGEFADEDFFA
jgi:hypothetical protein